MNLSLLRRVPSKAKDDRLLNEHRAAFQRLEEKFATRTPPRQPTSTIKVAAPKSPIIKAAEAPCAIDFKYNNNYRTKISKRQWDYMMEKKLCLSFNHQNEFMLRKDKVLRWVQTQPKKRHLLGDVGVKLFAVVINDQYAFRHIFKNGGTTVTKITKNKHAKYGHLGNRKLFATVRDPIDHFLSGWAECGFRSKNPDEDPSFAMNVDLDERIQNWLKHVQRIMSQTNKTNYCVKHSYPQTNFIIDTNNPMSIDPNIEFVGDLKELPGLLEMVGLKYKKRRFPEARAASGNLVKMKKYPTDKTKLSEETIKLICEFVILDYYLFAFEPPKVCRDQVLLDIKRIDKMSL